MTVFTCKITQLLDCPHLVFWKQHRFQKLDLFSFSSGYSWTRLRIVLCTGQNCTGDSLGFNWRTETSSSQTSVVSEQHKIEHVQKPHEHRNDHELHTLILQQHLFEILRSPNCMYETCWYNLVVMWTNFYKIPLLFCALFSLDILMQYAKI